MADVGFKLYVFDKGFLFSPPTTLTEDEIEHLHQILAEWDGRNDFLVFKHPIEVVDLRRAEL